MTSLSSTMTKNLIRIAWDRSMESAQCLMDENQIRHLAVTDEFGAIWGILSSHDLARAMHPTRAGFPDGALVCNYASHPVTSVRTTDSLADVADIMVKEKISSVLVVEGSDNVAGIITNEDLLRVFSQNVRASESKSSFRKLWPLVGELLKELQAAGI